MSNRDTTENEKKLLEQICHVYARCKKKWLAYDLMQKWQHLDEENRNHTLRYFNYSMSNLWFGIKDDFNSTCRSPIMLPINIL